MPPAALPGRAAEDALREFVIEAGRRLDRPPEEVEPYTKILVDNWFDSPESLADTKPEELANQGIPLRFAKELVSAASRGHKPSRRGGGKGKGKADGRDSERGRSRVPARRESDTEFKQRLDLWEHDPGFNLRGAIIGEKGKNMHHIQDQTSAKVWLGGEPGEVLHMDISAGTSRELHRAVEMAEDLLGAVHAEYEQWLGHGQREPERPRERGRGRGKAQGKGKEPREARRREPGKGGGPADVIDLWECDPAFNLKGKIIGDGGRNVHHIQDLTGSRLWIAGDPPRLEVAASSQDGLARAMQMARDLLGAVREDYARWRGEAEGRGPRDRGKGKGKGKDKGKDKGGDAGKGRRREADTAAEGEFMKVLKLKDTDPAYRLRGALIGDGGRNVHHIQDQTKAKLWLHGDGGQGMRLEISASSDWDLDMAVHMAKDLIKTTYQNYDEWLRNGRDERAGKGRRRRDEGEPPPKRGRAA